MPIPTQPYSSAGMPQGSRKVTFYRPTNPLAPGPAGGAGDTVLGIFLLEVSSPKAPTKLVQRMGIYGEDTDFNLVQQRKSINAVAQLGTGTTTTLQNGDYFEDTFDKTTSGTATANERYVIADCENVEQAGEPKKQNLTLHLDWNNSLRWA